MIHSTSNSSGANRPDAIGSNTAKRTGSDNKASEGISDNISSENTEALRGALAASPEVRPEEVARAKTLAVDPNYPPRVLIERLAELFVNASDPAQSE